jgi:hypothetical protein
MGSCSASDINELRDELRKNFDEIIYLNTENLKNMANNQISVFDGVAPEGLLKNTLTFYADNNSINICFHHSILTTIFKNHVDNFISRGKEI